MEKFQVYADARPLQRKAMAVLRTRKPRVVRYISAILGLIAIFHLLGAFSSRRTRPNIQYPFPCDKSFAQPERLAAVKREFIHAWTGYKDHAWMADSLSPLSGARHRQFCGWSATLVDSLDTLWLLGLHDEFDEAVNATLTIDFAHSTESCAVNLFESTIRYLGGMVAAYDLSHDQRLLTKLVELGDILHLAFDTPNGLPCFGCKLGEEGEAESTNLSENAYLADFGSLTLEFARLSQITGDPKYYNSALSLVDVLEKTQNTSSVPGLWPEQLTFPTTTSNVTDQTELLNTFATQNYAYSLGAMSDSTYEYLVKGHLLLGGINHQFSSMWYQAAVEIRRLMLFRAYIPEGDDNNNIIFSGILDKRPENTAVTVEPRTQHLACFAGGMFAMAGRIFDRPSDIDIGEGLTNGCVWAYQNAPVGIMPESFSLLPCPVVLPNSTSDTYSDFDLDFDVQCPWNATLWAEATDTQPEGSSIDDPTLRRTYPPGFHSVLAPQYLLRPEAIESVFIMWRITGDESWRDIGWSMFQRIIEVTRTPFGHASLSSVMYTFEQTRWEMGKLVKSLRPGQRDDMESFWLAETLKYFALLFEEPSVLSLDEWVLNTEAHPFRLTEGVRG